MQPVHAVLWKEVDGEGHDSALLTRAADGWQLSGTAVFWHAGAPCRLDYEVAATADWNTKTAVVRGWLGNGLVRHDIAQVEPGRWIHNGREIPEVGGCVDVDLNFPR